MPQPIIRPMTGNPDMADALLIVDPQVDFCPGGTLPVPGGDGIFPAVNRASAIVPLTVASRDWHPPDHISFQAQGGPWPVHCVAGTRGAEFHADLEADRIAKVFSKGTDPRQEAYSAFDRTGLADWLRDRHIGRLYVAGLATDYCVRASVLDARREGFDVAVLEDGIGAVDVAPGDGERALGEMREAGAAVVRSGDLD
ncbi:MAG TPA: nicotinamidase [Terriglobales bacterium]|nr:nicotinamidase [Terriglobales bacterium]